MPTQQFCLDQVLCYCYCCFHFGRIRQNQFLRKTDFVAQAVVDVDWNLSQITFEEERWSIQASTQTRIDQRDPIHNQSESANFEFETFCCSSYYCFFFIFLLLLFTIFVLKRIIEKFFCLFV